MSSPHPENPGTVAPLVGHEPERARLRALLENVPAGRGGAILVRGPAGAGKTALLDELDAQAVADGVLSLRAAGIEAESELAFCGLADLLGGVLDMADGLPDGQRLALLTALGIETPAMPTDRFGVLAAVRGLLERAATEHGPLLVIVDDVQWLDEDSRAALLFAARRAAGRPLAFVFAQRTGEGADVEIPGAQVLELAELATEDADALARELAPDSGADVRRALICGVGGNPLALVEAIAALDDDQLAGRSPLPDPIPTGRRLERHYAARVAALSVPTREALLLAAAADSADLALIADALAASGLADSALNPAAREGLMTLSDGSLRWRHPLVRSAIYLAVDLDARQGAHRELAAAAERADLPERRAWHLAAAATGPDEQVATALHEVAHAAQARGGPHVALQALERASALTPAPGPRAQRLAEASVLAVRIGHTERAAALAARATTDSDDPYLQAQVERVRAQASIGSGSPQSAYARLYALGCEWEERDPELAATLLCDCVTFDMANGDSSGYLRAARRALRAGRSAGPQAEALPGLLLGLGLLAMGRGDSAVEMLERYGHVGEQPELWSTAPELAGTLALGWVWIGRHDVAARMLEGPIARARDGGELRTLSFPLTVRAELNRRLGRLVAARTDAIEAVETAEDIGEGTLAANNLAYLARAEALLGDADACRANAAHSLELVTAMGLEAIRPYPHHALGLLELALGRPQEAAAQLARAPRAPLFSEPGLALWTGDLAEAHARAGESAAAQELLEEFELDVRRTGRAHGRAVLARVRGMLAADDEVDAKFMQAAQWHAAAGMPLEAARSQLCHGERLRRARRRVDARPPLQEALAAFTAMGAQVWAERARQELAATGRRTPTTAAPPWAMLTARETDVARAIIDGQTYDEAAQALFLSPRTVEHHLRQTYRKLGVRSRSELTILLRDADTYGTTE